MQEIAVSVDALEGPIDFAALFGNDHPVELEIGSGKGGFLLRQAQAHPERNYFGIEWANEYYKYSVDRAARRDAANVRIARTDARHFVIHHLPPASLSALHVYHPDPWPKKRHHKRRLFTSDFVEAAVRSLRPGGRWGIQTDHAEYFEVMRGLLKDRAGLEPVPFADAEYGTAEDRTESNFEVKYRREGRMFFQLAFRRITQQ